MRVTGAACGSFFQKARFQAGIVEDHHDDQQDCINEHAVIVKAAQKLRQNRKQGGGCDGTPDIAQTAENDENKHQDGGVEVEFIRCYRGKIHGIQGACHTGKGCGNNEGQKPVAGGGNTDAFCGDTVIAHRHDGASGPAVNQVKDEEQGDEYKDNTGSKGEEILVTPLTPHGPVDNHFSPVLQGEALFQKAEMEAIAVHSYIKHIDYVFMISPKASVTIAR